MVYAPRATGVQFIKGFMKDEGRIIRRPNSNRDDTLDLETFELLPTTPDEVVYTGQCSLSPFNSKDREFELADYPQYRMAYNVLLPANVLGVDIGDFLILDKCAYNEGLTGVPLRVMTVRHGTHKVYSKLWVSDIRPDRDPPLP